MKKILSLTTLLFVFGTATIAQHAIAGGSGLFSGWGTSDETKCTEAGGVWTSDGQGGHYCKLD